MRKDAIARLDKHSNCEYYVFDNFIKTITVLKSNSIVIFIQIMFAFPFIIVALILILREIFSTVITRQRRQCILVLYNNSTTVRSQLFDQFFVG